MRNGPTRCQNPLLRLVLSMLRHARWRHRVLSTPLHVTRVCQRRLRIDGHVGHVARRHVRVLRHASTLLLLHVACGGLLGRVHLVLIVDTVLVALVGLGSIQTSLRHVLDQHSACDKAHCVRQCAAHTWIRFLPSALVTSGWSLGVVNVYTKPVSDTTSSSTCVPVRTDSS